MIEHKVTGKIGERLYTFYITSKNATDAFNEAREMCFNKGYKFISVQATATPRNLMGMQGGAQ